MLLVASRAFGSRPWSRDEDALVGRKPLRHIRLIGAMTLTVAAIAALSYWDARRESDAALDDFAAEQATLARALAATWRARATSPAPPTEADLLTALRTVELGRSLVLLARRDGDERLRTTDGRTVTSARVVEALARGLPAVRIPREEAPAFGLHARTALAGLAHVDVPGAGGWDIVAVATAERQRDREVGARRRTMLSVFFAGGLVLAFGGLAMRNQRKELELERELAVEGLRRGRDERLERASRAAVMGTLAMGVAHEIATPLGVIAARAEQVAARVEGDERLAASALRDLGPDRPHQAGHRRPAGARAR